MINNCVSFGKKIPVTKCSIKDENKNKFVPATIYEFDCRDLSDINEVKALDGKWAFRSSIAHNMKTKYAVQRISAKGNGQNFYVIQADNGPVLALSQTHTKDNTKHLDYIERRKDKNYKYAGQALLAAIGFEVLKEGKKQLVITSQTDEAIPFYVDKCGFKECPGQILKMDKKHIKKFIRQTQSKTQSHFIDLRT